MSVLGCGKSELVVLEGDLLLPLLKVVLLAGRELRGLVWLGKGIDQDLGGGDYFRGVVKIHSLTEDVEVGFVEEFKAKLNAEVTLVDVDKFFPEAKVNHHSVSFYAKRVVFANSLI